MLMLWTGTFQMAESVGNDHSRSLSADLGLPKVQTNKGWQIHLGPACLRYARPVEPVNNPSSFQNARKCHKCLGDDASWHPLLMLADH
jgi:hypothetical protein